MQKSKEVLRGLTCKELAKMCKNNGIKHYDGKKIFTKEKMIDAILESGFNCEENEEQQAEEVKESVQELQEVVLTDEQKQQKIDRYIANAPIGSLVAFKEESGKVNTAMVIKRHKTKPMFMLETKYQKQFLVNYEDILWVKSENSHWPKGIYQLLKGGKKNANNDK